MTALAPARLWLGNAALALACVAVLLVGWTVLLERVSYERGEAVGHAVRDHSNLALAFEEHTALALEAGDQAVRLVRREYEEQGARLDIARLEKSGLIVPGIFNFIGVADAQGNLVVGNGPVQGVSVADRDYFAYLREHAAAGLYISRPQVGRVSDRPTLHLARRITLPDGGFGGVAIAGIDAEYFATFYRRVAAGRHVLIELVGLDGIVRVRRHGDEVSFGENVTGSPLLDLARQSAEGSYVDAGEAATPAQYVSFRRVPHFPMIVAVGEGADEILAGFRQRAANYYRWGAAGTGLVLVLWLGLSIAVTRRHNATLALRRSEALYRATFDQAVIGVAHALPGGRLFKVNAAFAQMLGYRRDELVGRALRDVMHPEDYAHTDELAKALFARSDAVPLAETETRFLRKDGSVLWAGATMSVVRDPEGEPQYFLGMVHDISQRKQAERQLEYQAYYDPLTGLPNRRLCLDRLAQALAHAARTHRPVGVLSIGLDRFKAVNDSFGRTAGDALLVQAAERLKRTIRASDTVARVGGDEFVVVLPDLARSEDAASVARKTLDALAAPLHVAGHEMFATASLGIATCPPEGCDAETLVRNAEAAMARAKQLERGTFRFYTASMNERAAENLLLENDLRRALERGEFLLHFQPKLDLASGEPAGFEALLRWDRGGKGLVPPGQFIPVLEDSGLIAPVGEWVIAAACRQMRLWREAGLEVRPVAVNVAAKQFLGRDIVPVIDRVLSAHELPPELLELEITESDAMRNPEEVVATLSRLRERRMRVAIDDFGTGYSSLGYLKRLPVDALKLDRSFVTGLPDDADDVSIARAVIAMAHSLGLKVVAEGVETDAQREFLAASGCDQMQGYLYSRPLPAKDCPRFLRRARPSEAAAD